MSSQFQIVSVCLSPSTVASSIPIFRRAARSCPTCRSARLSSQPHHRRLEHWTSPGCHPAAERARGSKAQARRGSGGRADEAAKTGRSRLTLQQ